MKSSRKKAEDAVESVIATTSSMATSFLSKIHFESDPFPRSVILAGMDSFSRLKLAQEGESSDSQIASQVVSIIVHSPDIFFSIVTLATMGLGRIFEAASDVELQSIIEIVREIYEHHDREEPSHD